MKTPLTRRRFLGKAALGGAGLLFLPSLQSVRGAPANDKMNLALIGVGGRGKWFVDTMPGMSHVVAMCDVNEERAGNAFSKIPAAKKFHDFRRMLESMDKEIEGVIIATPDNTHAVAASLAMKMGKHVYCEKPLTRTIHEARHLRQLAREHPAVATQMGNQGTASEAFRRAVDWIQAGAIGEVREVHAWNDSGGAGPRPVPTTSQEIPDPLHWDLWLGPAQARPYHSEWMKWHTWRDFATGQLGNWGVHTMNLAFKALKLDSLWTSETKEGSQVKIKARVGPRQDSTFPRWEIIDYTCPSRGELPPVEIHWHNGRSGPEARQHLESLLGRPLDWGDAGERKWQDHAGLILVGTKGKLHANGHNTVVTLLPQADFKDYQDPARSLPRSPGHEMEWLHACAGGPPALSHIEYGAPLTEFVLLGNVATQFDEELTYDPTSAAILNHDRAQAALHRDYRKGWQL